ncbi:hypothetical protein [Actinomyces lilanjuaniae]|uniref:HD domain-containing protein n=1 Tax=Actinomyces lilanjuaniae TaxID=2321394 RepID=UPI0019693E54|nr:hypothetical protein [Actinomyces lilanjuaniae]
MGVTDAPQWLLPAFVRSLRALGATASAEQVRSRGEHLIEQWSTPDRRFHNLRHLIDMLARVDELADESHSPDVMRVATWYHGCVFSTGAGEPRQHNGGENEEASAEVAVRDLSDLGVPEATTARVGDLIRNLTGHRLDTDDMDAAALADADLGALAVDPQTYKEYLRLLREEYAHVPLASYLETRLVIVGRLLEREKLFHSPLGEHWERPARQNLKAERQRLTEKLARLTPDEAGQHTECCPWQAEPASRRVPRSSDCSSSSLAEEPDDPRPSHDRSAALAGASTPTDESVAVQPPSPPLGAGDTSTVAEAESVTPHPSLTPLWRPPPRQRRLPPPPDTCHRGSPPCSPGSRRETGPADSQERGGGPGAEHLHGVLRRGPRPSPGSPALPPLWTGRAHRGPGRPGRGGPSPPHREAQREGTGGQAAARGTHRRSCNRLGQSGGDREQEHSPGGARPPPRGLADTTHGADQPTAGCSVTSRHHR